VGDTNHREDDNLQEWWLVVMCPTRRGETSGGVEHRGEEPGVAALDLALGSPAS
jgi:hypothetical protein